MSDIPDALPDAAAAFRRYEAVRARLPVARFPAVARTVADLGAVADRYDAFILDAFGVLNVGETPIPGAVARMAALRAQGKRLIVLTNAASYTRAEALGKYRRLGFDFTADEVVSSRDVAAARLAGLAPGVVCGAIAAAGDSFADLPGAVADVIDDPDGFDRAGAFLFLSSQRWTAALQHRLLAALQQRPRLLVVANPDIVAPREDGLSQEPGLYAHDLIDRLAARGIALPVRWYGKPFGDAYADARALLPGLAADRIAMVGDTLHTDVLGGAAAGMGTVLITAHGLFAGQEVDPFIAASGIRPDVIAVTT